MDGPSQNPPKYLSNTTQDFGTPIPCLVLHGSVSRDEKGLGNNLFIFPFLFVGKYSGENHYVSTVKYSRLAG